MVDNKNTDQDDSAQSESEKLDNAFHDMEMLYKSRCVDVPLTSNVKVVEIDGEKKKEDDEEDTQE